MTIFPWPTRAARQEAIAAARAHREESVRMLVEAQDQHADQRAKLLREALRWEYLMGWADCLAEGEARRAG